jgi:hypothetical protein
MKHELTNAFLNRSESKSLKFHHRAVMLALAFCCSFFVAWFIFTGLRGKHYILLAVSAIPLFLFSSGGGRFLKRALLGKG